MNKMTYSFRLSDLKENEENVHKLYIFFYKSKKLDPDSDPTQLFRIRPGQEFRIRPNLDQ
jgi:hypothetical protein